MQTIKPQDFSSRVTDPNRETWTLGTIAYVVEVLEGREVVVETDKRTGHSVQGRIVGYASSGSRNPGARLKVETSYVDEKGETRTQTTNYLLWEIGVIGHGPRAAELADQVATEIGEWDRGWGNNAPEPGFRMAVGDARDQLTAAEPRFVIDKTYSRLIVDWPRRS